MKKDFTYQGDELTLFQHAKNWKSYFSKQLKPYIRGYVLEVGAGIGTTTPLLNDGSAKSWVLLEPDNAMLEEIEKKINAGELPGNCSVRKGTVETVTNSFDTIIYIDVLEHIEDDKTEIQVAASLLNPGGTLMVLSPAFRSLYNPFDKAIGHFRRYNKKSLKAVTPMGLTLVDIKYYDSMGYFAAAANKALLRKKYPTQKQVLFWDRWMIPVSRLTDKMFFHSFGKSIIAIWKRG